MEETDKWLNIVLLKLCSLVYSGKNPIGEVWDFEQGSGIQDLLPEYNALQVLQTMGILKVQDADNESMIPVKIVDFDYDRFEKACRKYKLDSNEKQKALLAIEDGAMVRVYIVGTGEVYRFRNINTGEDDSPKLAPKIFLFAYKRNGEKVTRDMLLRAGIHIGKNSLRQILKGHRYKAGELSPFISELTANTIIVKQTIDVSIKSRKIFNKNQIKSCLF